MTTQKPPGTGAARHGSGDADLTLMISAHQAFSRDLVSLARAAGPADLANPVRRQAAGNGWQVFKRQLHAHNRSEDEFIWPVLGERLSHSDSARSVLAAMEEEHARIDPLLAAVDAAFAQPAHDRLADVIDTLATTLTSHLAHEETDALPLIGTALTGAEWEAVGRRIVRSNGLSAGRRVLCPDARRRPPERVAAVLAQLPRPLRLLYRAVWKPRYGKAGHW
jgi:hypothetical protein